MLSPRALAATAGALYLVTFLTSIPAAALNAPLLAGAADADPAAAAWASVLEVLLALSCIGTAVVLFPLIRRAGEIGALGFVASRTLEAGIIITGVVAVLSLSSLREAGTASDDPVAMLLVELHRWAFLLGPGLIPAVNALCLAPVLYRARLIPRVIPVVGMVGIPLLAVSAFATMFGLFGQTSPVAAALAAPIALWELGLGVWLVVRGFRPEAVARLV